MADCSLERDRGCHNVTGRAFLCVAIVSVALSALTVLFASNDACAEGYFKGSSLLLALGCELSLLWVNVRESLSSLERTHQRALLLDNRYRV